MIGSAGLTLHLLTGHSSGQIWLTAQEHLVVVTSFVRPLRQALEAVKVQLALERRIVGHAEEPTENRASRERERERREPEKIQYTHDENAITEEKKVVFVAHT